MYVKGLAVHSKLCLYALLNFGATKLLRISVFYTLNYLVVKTNKIKYTLAFNIVFLNDSGNEFEKVNTEMMPS